MDNDTIIQLGIEIEEKPALLDTQCEFRKEKSGL